MSSKSLFKSSKDKRNVGIAATVGTGIAALVGGIIAVAVNSKKKDGKDKKKWC